MLSYQWFYCIPSVLNRKYPSFMSKALRPLLLPVVFMLCFAGQAGAGQVDKLYDVDILVINESTSVREQVFQQGLDEVFVRISGDSVVMDKLKRPPPSNYIKRFSYEPVEKSTNNEKGEPLTHHLKIQYNGSLMEKYLRENGFPVWGEHRPDVVVWLAVRDGVNEYVLKDTDQSQLKTVVDGALSRRGIPERWPLYDYKDRKILSVADIRGGFKDPVTKASQRYSRGPVLAGSLIWNGKEWQSSWSLLMESGNRHWSLVDADYNVLINKAIDQAADALGVVFAVQGLANKQQLATIQLHIQAVSSIEKYRHVENYLTGLSSVAMARPLQVDGQSVIFELTLRNKTEDFLNLLHNDAELKKVEAIKTDASPLPENRQLTEVNITVDASGDPLAGVTETAVDEPEQPRVARYYYKFIN